MNSFQIALINVLITLFYILPGFIIRKMNKASSDHLPTLSAVLVYIGTPFLLLKAFMRLEFSWETLASMGWFFLVTILTQAIFMLLLFFLFRMGRNLCFGASFAKEPAWRGFLLPRCCRGYRASLRVRGIRRCCGL